MLVVVRDSQQDPLVATLGDGHRSCEARPAQNGKIFECSRKIGIQLWVCAVQRLVPTTVNSPNEREARARQGDVAAFGELIREWDHDLRGVVWSIVRSAPDTDDIMQAAYEKAFRGIADFRGAASMKTWLHSICYRCAIDHLRYEGRRIHESDAVLRTRAASESTSDAAISRSELATTLAGLDPGQRALLMLVAGLGYTFDEAATITNLPRGTVASRVGRARKALRQLPVRSVTAAKDNL